MGVLPAGTGVTYHVRTEDADGNVLTTFQRFFQVVPQWVQQRRLLLVEDVRFNRQVSPFYCSTLDSLGLEYDFWDTSTRGTPDPDDLALYQDGAVIWSVPNWDSYLLYDLNLDAATTALSGYLDGGGALFISGQYLFYLSWMADSFYDSYLHSDYASWCTVREVQGTPGDIIGDGLSFRIEGGDGANNQGCPHSINLSAL